MNHYTSMTDCICRCLSIKSEVLKAYIVLLDAAAELDKAQEIEKQNTKNDKRAVKHEKPVEPSLRGTYTTYKQETAQMLRDYRNEHGLGCFVTLAAQSKGLLTDTLIRSLSEGGKHGIETWRVLRSVIEKANKKTKKQKEE